MSRLLAWCVPASAFWSWRDAISVFYDGYWAPVEPRERLNYMAVYGVLPRGAR